MTPTELLAAYQALDAESGLTVADVLNVHAGAVVSIVLGINEGNRQQAAADLAVMLANMIVSLVPTAGTESDTSA